MPLLASLTACLDLGDTCLVGPAVNSTVGLSGRSCECLVTRLTLVSTLASPKCPKYESKGASAKKSFGRRLDID